MNRDTICVQGGYTPGNGEPRQIPIIQSTTFKYATSEDMGKLFDLEADGYFYSRLQNPTCDLVAKKICELEGGTAAMLTSSGQAANFFALFNLCEAGDHIVASSTIYGGTFNLISVTMKKMGITATFVDPLCSEEELDAAFQPNTKVVFGETIANPARTVLEIGQGTGLYTRRYAPLTSPDAALDLIDLYETPVPEVERKMVFHTGDAEKWLHDAPAFRRWDFITSASAIQWFSNMRGFLADCARHLENGGLVAFSSFAPGNLSEFDTLRPSPMLYATPDDIRRWASECFHDVEVTVDEITVAFPTARDALLHLRLTGVGGFSSHRFPLSKLLAAVPQNGEGLYTLTYRPLYLIARK